MYLKKEKRVLLLSLIAISLLAMMLFTSCSSKDQGASHKDDVYEVAGQLLKQNHDIFFNIFYYNQLQVASPENTDLQKESIFPVTDEKFKTYAELEKYVKSTYVASVADELLTSGLYVNRDGKLFADISKLSGGGYYVDWNSYRYEVSEVTDQSAFVNVYTTENAPNPEGTDEKRDITLTGKLVKENDTWLLEKIIQ